MLVCLGLLNNILSFFFALFLRYNVYKKNIGFHSSIFLSSMKQKKHFVLLNNETNEVFAI